MRSAFVLCGLSLLLAAGTSWSVAGAGTVPAFWLANVAVAPQFISGIALMLGAFATPFIFTTDELGGDARWDFTAKSVQAALWLAAVTAFMLQTAARVSPVSIEGIALASVWVFFTAWVALGLSRVAPRAANALLVAWIFVLPISAYMVVEVFLTSPAGGAGLAESSAPQAAALRETVRWILNVSPSTGMMGALSGQLADGTEPSVAIAVGEIVVVGAALLHRIRAD
ncbi:MAG: hypothetical protein WCT04_01770 [Planctomycetota bacterium]